MITFHGEAVTIKALADRYGVAWSTIKNRYERGIRGDALVSSKPLSHIEFNGELVSLTFLSRTYNLPLSTLANRYRAGLRGSQLITPVHQGKHNKCAATKLSRDQVVAIKKLLASNTLSQTAIAKQFGVDQSHISDIKRGKRWADVTFENETN